ncbi:MAG: thiamine diphosphokinase [Bacteroidales bacterium]|nr:thiamine diphosphokinase [Bacteroidales bacterium]
MTPLTFQPSAVVLAAGDFPTHPVPLQALSKTTQLVCCDSALLTLRTHPVPLAPGCTVYSIGDGDSLPLSLQHDPSVRFVHNPDQNTNDLTKAVHFCHDRGWHDLVIVGATGRREDHTLGNISLLTNYAELGCRCLLLTDYGSFCTVRGTAQFQSFAGQQVSLFSLDPTAPISAQGLRWPLCERRLTRWWEGTLNEATGNTFTVDSSAAPLLVFQTYDAKEAVPQ